MKPRILILMSHYLPGYLAGGPIRSIANMVELLGDEFEWLIVTCDRDLGADRPYDGVLVDAWNVVGKAKVFYASPASLVPWRLLEILRLMRYDLLYLNSFFSPRFSVLPVFARRLGLLPEKPILMAPRGEFSPKALLIKPLRKKAYLGVVHVARALVGVSWQASTELEFQHILKVISRVPPATVHVARDLALSTSTRSAPVRVERETKICFLSRVSPMKNLDFALRVLKLVRGNVRFEIFGPIEDEDYWRECQVLMTHLPAHVKVTYYGPVHPVSVVETLSRHDIFLLPTRGENFGHVLLEAWSAGIPVLVSDRTPWRNLCEAGVGWDMSLDNPAAFAEVIDEFSRLDTDDRAKLRDRCVKFAAFHAHDEVALEGNRRMFLQVLNREAESVCRA